MKDMKTVIDLFERSCEKFPDNPYLWEKKNGKFAATSYMEVKREVLNFAGALCQLGMDRGDRIALLSEGCNAWVYSELGMLYAGGVNVPLSIKLTDNEIVFRVEHSQARFLIVSVNFLNRVRGNFRRNRLSYFLLRLHIRRTVRSNGLNIRRASSDPCSMPIRRKPSFRKRIRARWKRS